MFPAFHSSFMRDKLGASASTSSSSANVDMMGITHNQTGVQNGDNSGSSANSNSRAEKQMPNATATHGQNGTKSTANQNMSQNGDPRKAPKTKGTSKSKYGFFLNSNANSNSVSVSLSAGSESGLVNTVTYNNYNGPSTGSSPSHSDHPHSSKKVETETNQDVNGSSQHQAQKQPIRSQTHDNPKLVENLRELKVIELRRALVRAKPLSAFSSNTKLSKDTAVLHRAFKLHLEICTHLIYDFNDVTQDEEEKDAKRSILIGLVEFISIQDTTGNIPERYFGDIVKMISANLFRSLPPKPEDGLMAMLEDEDPKPEKSWPHLQIVYEFLNRFILCSSVDARVAKKYITQKFISNLMSLFESDDVREREYLKTILHRIYAKFMVHRAFIRACIKNMFLTVTYEDTNTYSGIAEILEILASIINGFALPLKKEHIDSLTNVLIPLHKVKGLMLFHGQLSYCICQYVEKDKSTAEAIVKGLIKFWPATNSSKQVLFLHELEDILEITLREQVFFYYMVPFVEQIARCLDSPHFQVVEKILFMFQNVYLCKLIAAKNRNLIPLLVRKLRGVSNTHWNPLVIKMSNETIDFLKDLDANQKSYDKTQADRDYAETSNPNERLMRWNSLSASMK